MMIAHESQYNHLRQGNYWNSFTFGTVGVGRNTELAATVLGIGRPETGNRTLALGLKHRIPLYRNKGWEIASSVGAMAPVSLSGHGVGHWLYGNISVKAARAGTRVTAGPSHGSRQMFGRDTYSTMIGIEQPLNKRFSIICDAYTGTHDLGAAIFAIGYHPNPDFMLIAGWKAANNAASGKPAFMVEVTYMFGFGEREAARH